MTDSFLQIKFNSNGQSSCSKPYRICSKNHALKFVDAGIKIMEMISFCNFFVYAAFPRNVVISLLNF